jgi:hypothetical protein
VDSTAFDEKKIGSSVIRVGKMHDSVALRAPTRNTEELKKLLFNLAQVAPFVNRVSAGRMQASGGVGTLKLKNVMGRAGRLPR